MPQNFPKISHGTPCNTSSSPATSIRSIHSPIITLLALEKGQLVSRWRHFRMEKAQSESKLNCKLTCAVDQLCLFMFRTNKRTTKKKGKEKEAVTGRGGKLGSASYTECMRLMRGMYCCASQTVSLIFPIFRRKL